MVDSDATVKRTLHLKFTWPTADAAQLSSLLKAAAPFYEMMGGMRIHLLQNVDNPTRFIQVLAYESPAALELNRQQIASDPTLQAYLQAWRSFVPGGVEVDVYQEIAT